MVQMIFWRNIVVGFIIFTSITIVILLQVLMFIQNCVPQTNGILLNAGISITYFILSLVSLATLFGAFETVSYGLKSIIMWTRITILIYGLLLMVMGVLVFALELPKMEERVTTSWSGMSQY